MQELWGPPYLTSRFLRRRGQLDSPECDQHATKHAECPSIPSFALLPCYKLYTLGDRSILPRKGDVAELSTLASVSSADRFPGHLSACLGGTI